MISLNAQIAAQGRKALLDAEGVLTFNAFGETIRMYLPDVALEVIARAHKTLDKFKPPMWIELIPRFGEVAPATEALKEIEYELAYRFGRTDYLFHHKDNKIKAAQKSLPR